VSGDDQQGGRGPGCTAMAGHGLRAGIPQTRADPARGTQHHVPRSPRPQPPRTWRNRFLGPLQARGDVTGLQVYGGEARGRGFDTLGRSGKQCKATTKHLSGPAQLTLAGLEAQTTQEHCIGYAAGGIVDGQVGR